MRCICFGSLSVGVLRRPSSLDTTLGVIFTENRAPRFTISDRKKNGSTHLQISLNIYPCCNPHSHGICQLFPGLSLVQSPKLSICLHTQRMNYMSERTFVRRTPIFTISTSVDYPNSQLMES